MFLELRHAVRSLLRRPLTSLAVTAILALGMAASTAAFTLVNGLLLRRLPFPQPDRLTAVYATTVAAGTRHGVSYPNFQEWRAEAGTFEELAAYARRDVAVAFGNRTERQPAEFVSAAYFDLLGARPLRGGWFAAGGDPRQCVISEGFWRERLGAPDDIVGAKLLVGGAPFTVAGVAREGFAGYSFAADLWLPIEAHGLAEPKFQPAAFDRARDIHWLRVLGRRKPGVTIERASAEVAAIAARQERTYPAANRGRGAAAADAHTLAASGARSSVALLAAATGVLMLIACVSAAGILLAGMAARERELQVRVSLGATPARLIRELAVEPALLALAAVALAVPLARAILRGGILPVELPRFVNPAPDARVFAFAAALGALAVAFAAFAPAVRAVRAARLTSSARGATASLPTTRLQNGFVAAQFGLMVLLLAAAGVLARTLDALSRTETGFETSSVSVLRADFSAERYRAAGRALLLDDLLPRLAALPGVAAASLASGDPLVEAGIQRGFVITGRPPVSPAAAETVYCQDLAPGYFAAMGIPLRAGRDFTRRDAAGAPGVAIVSETFARRFFSGDALGKAMSFGSPERPHRPMTVVGVVADTKLLSLAETPGDLAAVYTPLLQAEFAGELSLILRSANPGPSLAAARTVVERFDRMAPVIAGATLEGRLAGSLAAPRARAVLLGAFALFAVLLAAAGSFGVAARAALDRRREFGVRLALGATPEGVLRLALVRGLAWPLAGVAGGLGFAWPAARLLEGFVYRMKPFDPWTVLGVIAAAVAIAAAAPLVPAWRASRVDPLRALAEL